MPRKGKGLLMVYADVPAEVDEEFNRWYNEEHIPERLSIPGVLNAARYEAVKGGPKYLACYELSEAQAHYSDVWQGLLKNPTEWSRRMSPSVVAENYINNLYMLVYPQDNDAETGEADMAPALLVGRMSVPDDIEVRFNQVYNNQRLPLYRSIPGYIRGRRFAAVKGDPKYITVHEMESTEVADSPEWEGVRTTITPEWNETINPKMTHAAGSPGVYRKIFQV